MSNGNNSSNQIDVIMTSEASKMEATDEEMKTDLEDIPLLKRFSSEAKVEPYSRVTALTKAVKILESLILKYQAEEPVP